MYSYCGNFFLPLSCFLFSVLETNAKSVVREPNVFIYLLMKQLFLVANAYKLARIHQRSFLQQLVGSSCISTEQQCFPTLLSVIGVSNFNKVCWWLLMTSVACQTFIDLIYWLIYILAALINTWMLRINPLVNLNFGKVLMLDNSRL